MMKYQNSEGEKYLGAKLIETARRTDDKDKMRIIQR